MSEQARQVFNLKEQKAKDVLAAIQVVKPALSLAREWGRKTIEYTQLTKDNARLANEIESIKHVISLTSTGSTLAEELKEVLNEKSSEHEASLKKEEELKKIYEDMEREIILYQEYAKQFDWIDQNILRLVLKLNNFEDKEEYFSMMFLLLNANISEFNLEPLCYFINKEGYYANVLISSRGWNWMLEKLVANEL